MSEQYKSLDPAARARYLAKLQVLGLKEADDPFATWNNSKFEDNRVFGHPLSTCTSFAILWSVLGCTRSKS